MDCRERERQVDVFMNSHLSCSTGAYIWGGGGGGGGLVTEACIASGN